MISERTGLIAEVSTLPGFIPGRRRRGVPTGSQHPRARPRTARGKVRIMGCARSLGDACRDQGAASREMSCQQMPTRLRSDRLLASARVRGSQSPHTIRCNKQQQTMRKDNLPSVPSLGLWRAVPPEVQVGATQARGAENGPCRDQSKSLCGKVVFGAPEVV